MFGVDSRLQGILKDVGVFRAGSVKSRSAMGPKIGSSVEMRGQSKIVMARQMEAEKRSAL